jgi:hypothetical protein
MKYRVKATVLRDDHDARHKAGDEVELGRELAERYLKLGAVEKLAPAKNEK